MRALVACSCKRLLRTRSITCNSLAVIGLGMCMRVGVVVFAPLEASVGFVANLRETNRQKVYKRAHK